MEISYLCNYQRERLATSLKAALQFHPLCVLFKAFYFFGFNKNFFLKNSETLLEALKKMT